jgi:Rrf2 family protein
MKASTRYTTAIHVCVFLNHMQKDIISSALLAESVNTNPVVIRRLIQDLISHQLVISVPGPKGGFRLSRPASEISLWDLYKATRENALFRPPRVNPKCVVSSHLKILVHDAHERAEESMGKVLAETSVQDLTYHLKNILGENAEEALRRGH